MYSARINFPSFFVVFLLHIHFTKVRNLQYPFPESGSIYLSLSVSLTDFNSVKKKNISLT